MSSPNSRPSETRRLFAFAVEREGRDLRRAGLSCLATGVGKTAAAAALAVELARGETDLVVWVGVAGAYPSGPEVGAACVVGESVFGDEGALTERGFLDLPALGLAESGAISHPPDLAARVAAGLGDLRIVRAATVSTCSGRDELSAELAARTGAGIETMESASAAWVCRGAGVPLVELRCVSNRTGDRERAGWRLGEAADRAQELALRALELRLLEPTEDAS